jgi:hypothetical protein
MSACVLARLDAMLRKTSSFMSSAVTVAGPPWKNAHHKY